MDPYFLKLSDVKKNLNIENDDDVLDLLFFYDIDIYGIHPDIKDIRKIYYIEKPIKKSVRVSFGLNDQEIVYVNKFYEAQYAHLDAMGNDENCKHKFEFAKSLLSNIGLVAENGIDFKFDERPHYFHTEVRGFYWQNKLVLKNTEDKTHTLLDKSKILVTKKDLTKIKNLICHNYQFNDDSYVVTVDKIKYPLGITQYQIIKAIYDLTHADPAIRVRKSDISTLFSNLKEVTKGIADHFKSAGDSPEFKFWSNFVEVTSGKLDKKDQKSSFDKADYYRIKIIKSQSYHVDKIDLSTWMNRPQKD